VTAPRGGGSQGEGLAGSGAGRGARPVGAGGSRLARARAGERGSACGLRVSMWAGRGEKEGARPGPKEQCRF
jgi:hypothetical protein